MLLVLLAFATSLGALGAAAGSASWRCGSDSGCSYELALAIVAIAPACLIGIVVVLLMRMRAEMRWLRTLLLAAGVGVAAIPLASFLIRDVWLIPAFAALLAAMVVLVLWGEREAVEGTPEPEPVAAGTDAQRPIAEQLPPEAWQRPVTRPRIGSTLALLQHLSVLNTETIRLCEMLPGQARIASAPERTSPPESSTPIGVAT